MLLTAQAVYEAITHYDRVFGKTSPLQFDVQYWDSLITLRGYPLLVFPSPSLTYRVRLCHHPLPSPHRVENSICSVA